MAGAGNSPLPQFGAIDDAYFASMPKLPPPPPPSNGTNPLVSGFVSGAHGLGADLAGFVGAAARAGGITPLAQGGEFVSNALRKASQAASVPEYEEHPWSVGGMAYNVAKAAPTLASLLVGGEVLAPTKVPTALAAAGRMAPRWLGGAGGAVGEAAEAAGSQWAKHLVGGGVAGYPVMAGGAYGQQLENGGPDQNKARLALAVGVPEAAVGAVMPAQLRSLAENGMAGTLFKRVLTGGAAAGAAGAVQSGVQAALNQPFEDPDLSFGDRAKHIVQSALMGGAVGGLFGAAGSALGGQKPLGREAAPNPPGAPAPFPGDVHDGPEGFQQRRMDDASVAHNQPATMPPAPSAPEPGLPFQQRRMGEPDVLPGAPVYSPPLQLEYRPQGGPTQFAGPNGEIAPNLGVYDQRAQAPMGYQHEMFGQPLQEQGLRNAPAPLPENQPAQLPGFDAPGEAPAPVAAAPEPVAADPLAGLTKQTQNWIKRNGGTLEAAQSALQAKLETNKPLTGAQARAAEEFEKLSAKGEQNAVQERSAAPVDAREQAGPSPGVREGDAPRSEAPSPRPEDAPAQAPVEGAAQAPAPVEGQVAPAAGAVGGGIPFMVTAKMKADLAARGKTPEEIRNMTPAQAHEFLNSAPEATKPAGPVEPPAAPVEAPVAPAAPPEVKGIQRVGANKVKDAGSQSDKGGHIVELSDGRKMLATKNEGSGGMGVDGSYMLEALGPDGKVLPTYKGKDIYDRPNDTNSTTLSELKEELASGKLQGSIDKLFGASKAAAPPEPLKPSVPLDEDSSRGRNPSLDSNETILAERAQEAEGLKNFVQFGQSVRDLELQNMRAQGKARDEAPVTSASPEALRAAAAGAGTVETIPHTALPASPAKAKLETPVLKKGGKPLSVEEFLAFLRDDKQHSRSAAGVEETAPDQGVVDLAANGGDIQHVLAHIANTSPSQGQSEIAARLLGRAQEAGIKSPVKIGEDDGAGEFGKTNATYDRGTGEITFNRTAGASRDALHEVVHPLTNAAADANSPGWRVLKKLFSRVSDAASPETKADPTLSYAFNAPGDGDVPAREFMAEAHSNPYLQAYLKAQSPGLWQQVKNAFGRMLGIEPRLRNAFDQVMDISSRVMNEAKELPLTDGRPPVPGHEPVPGSVPHVNEMMRSMSPWADQKIEELKAIPMEAIGKMGHISPKVQEGWRKLKSYTADLGHIAWELDRYGLHEGAVHDSYNRERSMIGSNMVQVGAAPDSAISRLPAKEIARVNSLMAYSPLGVDPMKSWDDHIWLHNKPNKDELRSTVEEANKVYRDARSTGAAGPYEQARTAMDATLYAETYARLYHNMRLSNPESMGSIPNAVREFNEAKGMPGLHESPAVAKEFWAARLTELKSAAEGVVSATPESQSSLASHIKAADTSIANLKGPAYFSAMHGDGEYFAGAKIATAPDGRVLPASVDAVSDALQKAKFDGLVVHKDLDSNRIFFRVDTPGQQRDAARVLQKLEKAGHLVKNEDGSSTIKSGRVADPSALSGIGPRALERDIAALRAQQPEPPAGADDMTKAAYEEAHEQAISAMVRQWLGTLPDNSLTTVLQRREGVHAYNQDMVGSYRRRVLKGASAVADYGTRADISENMRSLRDGVAALKGDPGAQVDGRATGAQTYADEIYSREARKAWSQSNPYLDAAQSAVSTLHVGSSPMVGLMMLSQVPMFTVPQLVKHFPYRTVVPMLGKTAAEAFNTTRAVLSGEYGSSGGFSRSELVNALGEEKADFHMGVSNKGGYTGGTFLHMMADNIERAGPSAQKAVGWANAIGRYTELFPRIWTAAAARELYNSLPKERQAALANSADDYALHSVLQSQKDYSSSATSRFTGKSGPFGAMTPLMLSFTAFQTRVLSQYYREVSGVLGRIGDTPEARKTNQAESGKWLLGHAAATMAIAGSMGLPGAALMAGAYDKIATALTGRDDTNIEAGYRRWLDSVFGSGAGAVIARGLPRGVGVDMSDMGFQHIIPFTRLMTNKRKFEDAESDFLHSMAGAAFGDIMNVGLGARDMMNGDYLLGLQKMAPEALKGAVGAYRAEMYGYVNKEGTALPLQPTHLENLLTAVGIEPARKADYDEAAKASQGLSAQRQYREQNISRHLVLAQQTGDSDAGGYWGEKAREFMQNNPGLRGPLQGFGTQLARQAQLGAQSRGLGMPMGIRANDIAGRRLTDFGNWR